MNKVELQKQIQYRLSMLSTENKHHEFEELCRHIAKEKVCNNIVPATGPVSSGGDQGRDFETFKSFIDSTEFDGTRCFLGSNQDNHKIVFACTLQKKNIKSKIKADLESITQGYTEQCSVYFFSESPVSVGTRHEIQSLAKNDYNINIEIFDSLAISDFLTEARLFWVASHFLDIAREFYPACIDDDPEYSELKRKWLTDDLTPFNYSDFHEISSALRTSSIHHEKVVDLELWLAKIQHFEHESYPVEIARQAIFDTLVATLKAKQDLNAEISRIDKFFSGINIQNSINELELANSLLMYVGAAMRNGFLDFELNVLMAIRAQFEEILDERLRANITPDSKCRLFLLKGLLLTFREGILENEAPEVSKLLPWIEQILDLVPKAPLLPLRNLSKIMTITAEFIDDGDMPTYQKLAPRLDQLVSEQVGKRAAANNAIQRAIKFYQNAKYCYAIKELHSAKIDWFSNESINYSIKAMLMLSDCYKNLDLHYPSLYYSAAAAFISVEKDSDELNRNISAALINNANTRCYIGDWFSFLQIASSAVHAHVLYDDMPLDLAQHEHISEFVAQIVLIVACAYRIDNALGVEAHRLFKNIPFDSDLHCELEQLISDRKEHFIKQDDKDFFEQLEREFNRHPFSDTGSSRTIYWKALGISWSIDFENNVKSCLAAEEVANALQIIHADLAQHDFLLLPTSIDILIRSTEGSEFLVEEKASNDGEVWEVIVPVDILADRENHQTFFSNIVGLALSMLNKVSLAKQEKIFSDFEEIFSKGIAQKIHFVGSYYGLLNWTQRNADDTSESHNFPKPVIFKKYDKPENSELRWIDSLGPTYSAEKAKEAISNRYRRAIKPIRQSLPILMRHKEFSNRISDLKKEGWPDWQILNLITGVALNYKNAIAAQDVRTPQQAEMAKRAMLELVDKEEDPNTPSLPLALFLNDKQFEMYKITTIVPTLQTWDLDLKQSTPDIDAITQFMNVRYNASKDDIEHEDFFGWK